MKEKKLKKRWIVLIVIIGIFVISKIYGYIQDNMKTNGQTYRWPDTTLAKMLPQPDSDRGEIISNSETGFNINIRKTSEDDFKDYVDKCREKGFTEDYDQTEHSYSAQNKDKYDLDLFYTEDEKEMKITLYAPEKEEPEKTQEDSKKTQKQEKKTVKKKSSAKKTSGSAGVSPEFKKTMDRYEEFFDEYIKFMKKYQKSSNPASMMKDYADYMDKYTKYMDQLNELDNKEMTDAETIYYTKVNARILEKLAELE